MAAEMQPLATPDQVRDSLAEIRKLEEAIRTYRQDRDNAQSNLDATMKELEKARNVFSSLVHPDLNLSAIIPQRDAVYPGDKTLRR